MKRLTATGILCLVSVLVFTQPSTEPEQVKLDTAASKASYAFAMDMAQSINGLSENLDFTIDTSAFLRGVEDVLKNRETLLTKEEARHARAAFITDRKTQRALLGEKNKKEGESFLGENGKKERVVTMPSGLQYTVLHEGGGASPKATDMARVLYRATLLDGTEFAASKQEQPEAFAVSKVIPGLSEALQLMKVGSKYRFFIPSDLAFRDRPRGRLVAPHATVIYEIELVAIEPQ
jgi:FKBP-type peptidyl-prolyl cis-trans isomerase